MEVNRPDNLKLYFNEELHKYTDNYGNVPTSMTTVIGKYHIPFDPKGEAKKYIKKHKLDITPEQLQEQWDNIKDHSCERGNNTHNTLEAGVRGTSMFKECIRQYANRRSDQLFTVWDINFNNNYGIVDIDNLRKAFDGKYDEIVEIIEWLSNQGYRFYAEVGVYSFSLLISGLIDLLAIHPDGYFYIIDWKTNRNAILFEAGYYRKDKKTRQITNDFVRQYEKKMLNPIAHLDDCTGVHYQLQTSGYGWLVEQTLGFECRGIRIVHIRERYQLNNWGMPLKDDNGFYIPIKGAKEIVERHKIKYLREEPEILFNHHYRIFGDKNRQNQMEIF